MMDSGPGACSQNKMKIENDGWYINLEYGLACEIREPGTADGPIISGLSRSLSVSPDRTRDPRFPLSETTTMYGEDGRATLR
jgi:hypothetical protein